MEDETSLFIVPLVNSETSVGFGTITIATDDSNGIASHQQRAVETVGVIATLTLSWCELIGDVRRDIKQLSRKVESLEQSVADHARQSRFLQQDGAEEEGSEAQYRHFRAAFNEVLSDIPRQEDIHFSSDDAHPPYIDRRSSPARLQSQGHQPKRLLVTPSKTVLSMAIGQFLD